MRARLVPGPGKDVLRVFVFSSRTYRQGRPYGVSEVRLPLDMSRKHRRTMLALAIRDARYSYQQLLQAQS